MGEIRTARMIAITNAKVATNETATATANQTAEARQVMKVNPMPTAKMVICDVISVIQRNTLSGIAQISQDQVNVQSVAVWVMPRRIADQMRKSDALRGINRCRRKKRQAQGQSK